jgi:hypothetical protein
MVGQKDLRSFSKTPYTHVFRVSHWLLLLTAPILFITGLNLHAATAPDSWLNFHFLNFITARHPLWHWNAALLFFPATVGAAFYFFKRNFGMNWNLRRTLNTLLILSPMYLSLSGLLMLNAIGPEWLLRLVRWGHILCGLIWFPLFFATHLIRGLRNGRILVHSFRPFAGFSIRPWIVFGLLAVLPAILANLNLAAEAFGRSLTVKRIESPGTDMTALPWQQAQALRFRVFNGLGFNGGCTQIDVRALHDDSEIFFRAEWEDATDNQTYFPWKKTADGWRRLVTNENDESVYYEDKFSLVFAAPEDTAFKRFGCAWSCHLGGDHAYGYKGCEKLVDVWHWKMSRTQSVGQADDQFWQGFDLKNKNVGRQNDPHHGGGYENNYDKKNPDHPVFLLNDSNAIKNGAILKHLAEPYSAEAANRFAPGTFIPGIIVAPFEGDRGDVQTVAKHENGRRIVFFRRKLDTGSDKDVKFESGSRIPFACAAFDHTSNRHAYNLRVFYLSLEK